MDILICKILSYISISDIFLKYVNIITQLNLSLRDVKMRRVLRKIGEKKWRTVYFIRFPFKYIGESVSKCEKKNEAPFHIEKYYYFHC